MEHPLNRPEWHSLLAVSKTPIRHHDHPVYSIWQEELITWHALQAFIAENPDREQKGLPLLEELSEQGNTLIDVSEHWLLPTCRPLLERADICLFVADPWPSRWSPLMMKQYRELLKLRGERSLPTFWIANKDVKFSRRKEWLGMVPGQLLTTVPQLSAAEWAECLWRGGWATDSAGWRKLFHERLQPLWQYFLR